MTTIQIVAAVILVLLGLRTGLEMRGRNTAQIAAASILISAITLLVFWLLEGVT